eukprot:4793942-Prymnesium_polylepis.1
MGTAAGGHEGPVGQVGKLMHHHVQKGARDGRGMDRRCSWLGATNRRFVAAGSAPRVHNRR